MTIADAREAFDAGRIFMAHRLRGEFVELVVLTARERQPARGYFTPPVLPSYRTPAEVQQRNRERLSRPVETLCGQTFASITEAAKATGIGISNIQDAIRGRQKTAAGFRWRYL